MKKYILTLATALIALGFTACEDVPAPYGIYTGGESAGSEQGGVKTVPYEEAFTSTLGSFTNYTTDGSGKWVIDYSTAKATGWDGSTTTAGTYYLVSPEISLEGQEAVHITYDYILRYNKGDENQQLLITDSFDASNPAAGWTVLTQKHTEGSDWNTFSANDVDIPSEYMGKTVRIALRYNTNAESGSTWEVKNFKALAGKAAGAADDDDPTTVKTLPYTEAFSSTLGSFKSYLTSGSGAWVIDFSTAKATGWDGSATTAGTYYLVSPEISLEGQTAAYVSYEYILRYNKGEENQQLLITDSFDENNAANGWKLLNQTHTEGTSWSVFSKAEISIPSEYMGKKVRIAFRYNTNAESGSTWEVKNFSALSGTPGTPGGDTTPDEPSTETPAGAVTNDFLKVTMADLGLENGKTPGVITLSDGTTLTIEKNGGATTPAYYTNGANLRIYPSNSIAVKSASKKINAIVFNCDEYSGTLYNASGNLTAVPGKVQTSGTNVWAYGIGSTETLITNSNTGSGAPTQLRFTSFTIYYAE